MNNFSIKTPYFVIFVETPYFYIFVETSFVRKMDKWKNANTFYTLYCECLL